MVSTTEADVIRMYLQGHSQRHIEKALRKSRHTISRTINAFKASEMDRKVALSLSGEELNRQHHLVHSGWMVLSSGFVF